VDFSASFTADRTRLAACAVPATSVSGRIASSCGGVRPATARLTPYDRLRRAGDQQLEEYADIPGATRSYQKALQIASSDQRRIAPDRDTWLLMALKHSSNFN